MGNGEQIHENLLPPQLRPGDRIIKPSDMKGRIVQRRPRLKKEEDFYRVKTDDGEVIVANLKRFTVARRQ